MLEKLYGTDEPPASWRTLVAGPLSVDLENGQLRYLRWHGVEVLRAVSFLVRDQHWGTYGAVISELAVEPTADRFTVRYRARCAPGAGDLVYGAEIVGEASGRLSFVVSGAPEAALRTNRTGFVVLHSLVGTVGEPMDVEHTDGSRQTVTLPEAISPHEPIRDIFALTHRPAPGVSVRVEMTGDAYDMEDQRNWTDASLKSYVRPLSRPWPYVIGPGEAVHQSVTVTIVGAIARPSAPAPPAALAIAPTRSTMPAIGVAVEAGDVRPALDQLSAVQEIAPGRLVVRAHAPDELAAFAALQRALPVPLTLQFPVPGVDPMVEVAAWAVAAAQAGLSPAAVLATPYRLYPLRPPGTSIGDAPLAELAAAARAAFPRAEIGGGVPTAFTEFNRNRPPVDALDFVTHATSAIVHAADDRSVMESLEALRHVFASARAIAPGKPYRVGPSAIGLALNPDGPPRWRRSGEGRGTMTRNDPRQAGLFAAAWTLGYLAEAVGRLDEVTPGHATGDLGVIGPAGELRPVYHVVRGIAHAAGQPALQVTTGAVALAGLGFRSSDGDEVWLANLTPAPAGIELAISAVVARLDMSALPAAAGDPKFLDRLEPAGSSLMLGPFAVARLVLR